MKKVQIEQDMPEALFHAKWLGNSLTIGAPEAAAELIRLHEENKKLKETLENLSNQSQRPLAWYVKRNAPGRRDHGMKLGPFWKLQEAQEWVDENHTLHEMFDTPSSIQAQAVCELNVTDEMACAFHRALDDSSLGSNEIEQIKTGLRAALANIPAFAANKEMFQVLNVVEAKLEELGEHDLVGMCAAAIASVRLAENAKNAEKRKSGLEGAENRCVGKTPPWSI